MSASSQAGTSPATYQRWQPILLLAAQEVYSTMLSTELLSAAEPAEMEANVTAMVGLAGQLCGVVAIRCDGRAATLMASKMLGIDPASAGPDTWDAVGEVCNMVAGNFKNKVSGLAEGCMLSVPTVITGADYKTHTLANQEEIHCDFLFEGCPIEITLQIQS